MSEAVERSVSGAREREGVIERERGVKVGRGRIGQENGKSLEK